MELTPAIITKRNSIKQAILKKQLELIESQIQTSPTSINIPNLLPGARDILESYGYEYYDNDVYRFIDEKIEKDNPIKDDGTCLGCLCGYGCGLISMVFFYIMNTRIK